MYTYSKEEFWNTQALALFRHFVPEDPHPLRLSARLDVQRGRMTRSGFMMGYYAKFFRDEQCGTDDPFDPTRTTYDDLGIAQEPHHVNRLRFLPPNFGIVPTQLNHVQPWVYRQCEYAATMAKQYHQHSKFDKLKALRKLQKELPIAERAQEIVELLEKNQVLIVAGDTGCGKSTQVPQYLLKAGYTGIACTQPRRIACTALAKRVAYETLNQYGSEVAFQIRFETTKSQRTKLLFLTEGLLLRQMENDSLLQQYNVIILDEVHERHLTSDLLMGLLKDLCQKREDLKLILMSATINLELFKSYFSGAPVIQVPGRLHPIELRWHPIKQFVEQSEKKPHKIDPEPYLRILELIDKQFPSSQRGDALIFLNGVAEISTVAEHLKNYAEQTKGWIILMLHSTLSVEEQDKVFDLAPPNVRKCILATNVAETSITIDGIRFVIDSGKVNLIKHEPGTGSQKLTEFWVSKASADQRKGRAGRTGPGICYRLYSQEQFEKMDDFTMSEINRVSLQEMALKMISLNLGLDPRTFPFIEKPSEDVLNEGLEMLKFQRVLRSDRENLTLTALGNMVSKLPVEVPIAKMLVFGCVVDEVEVMLTVAAGMSVQSPFTNRSYRELEVVERRASLTSAMGDPFTLIAVFREWVLQKTFEGTARRWALENGIDEHRLYEIGKLRSQYRRILEDAGLVEAASAEETGQNDSRQRRIELGEKRKLNDLKRAERNNERRQKVLNANKHFDTILAEKEDEDVEAEKDPLKADVKTVEFLLSHKERDVEKIRQTHKLSRRKAEVIRVVIAAGLYPNFSILDPVNKYGYGQEMFVHTRHKPFTQIHPNSSIAQYHAESIDARQSSDGFSALHQIPFYGTLLETTKPYICNVMPVPAVYTLLVAQKIVVEDWTELIVDDFLEMKFRRQEDLRSVLLDAKEIRYELTKGLAAKLVGEESFSGRRLNKYIELLSRTVIEKGVEISVKRNVHPAKVLTGIGIHTPDGAIDKEQDVDELVQKFKDSEEFENCDEDDEDQKILDELRSDVMCPPTRDMVEEEADMKEKLAKEAPKESYYEKLLKRQKAKEDGTEKAEKRPKIEVDE